MIYVSVFIGLLVAGVIADKPEWKYCGNNKAADIFQINSIDATPWPPRFGGEFSLTLDATLTKDVTADAIYDISVKTLGITVFEKKGQFSEMAQKAGVTLPIKAGSLKKTFSYTLPYVAIPGKVDVHLFGSEPSGELFCIETSFEFSNPLLGAPTLEDIQKLFAAWVEDHEKTYSSQDEFAYRFNIFKRNFAFVTNHNGNTARTYDVEMNQFADLTRQEYAGLYLGYRDFAAVNKTRPRLVAQPRFKAPAAVDWRKTGAVTPVKNQAQCGSCWAFSTTGAIEGATFLKSGKLYSLSEQELVDCDRSMLPFAGDHGCNGGLMDTAFRFVEKAGLCLESDYKYEGVDGQCQKTCTPVPETKITAFTDVEQSEEALIQAVANQPVAIAIEADQQGFQFYSGGVFTGPCGTNLDHGVLLVGYTKDAWIVKNSWGPSWGDQGYIKIARGQNLCGIQNSASFPTF